MCVLVWGYSSLASQAITWSRSSVHYWGISRMTWPTSIYRSPILLLSQLQRTQCEWTESRISCSRGSLVITYQSMIASVLILFNLTSHRSLRSCRSSQLAAAGNIQSWLSGSFKVSGHELNMVLRLGSISLADRPNVVFGGSSHSKICAHSWSPGPLYDREILSQLLLLMSATILFIVIAQVHEGLSNKLGFLGGKVQWRWIVPESLASCFHPGAHLTMMKYVLLSAICYYNSDNSFLLLDGATCPTTTSFHFGK